MLQLLQQPFNGHILHAMVVMTFSTITSELGITVTSIPALAIGISTTLMHAISIIVFIASVHEPITLSPFVHKEKIIHTVVILAL